MAISAIGSFVPEARVSNAPLLLKFNKDLSFLEHKLGFMVRAHKPAGLRTSDLSVRAFEDLERVASLDRDKVQLLVLVTQNPDQKIPHTSAIVHHKLHLSRDCATFDISQGCAGYPHGLAIVQSLMTTYRLDVAVLITCDPYSEIVDPEDAATAMVFGDAATATLMTRDRQGYSLRDVLFGTVPNSYECLVCQDRFFMDGRRVAANVVHEVPDALHRLLSRNNLRPSDVSFYAFHQASRYIIELLRTTMGLTESAAPFEAAEIGNSVSSSIPLLLQQRINDAKYDQIVMCGFGIGFSWAVGLLEAAQKGEQA